MNQKVIVQRPYRLERLDRSFLHRHMQELGNLIGQRIGMLPKDLKQGEFVFQIKGKNVVDIFRLNFPHDDRGHGLVMGIGFADEYFIQIIFAAGGGIQGLEKVFVTVKELEGRSIVNGIYVTMMKSVNCWDSFGVRGANRRFS